MHSNGFIRIREREREIGWDEWKILSCENVCLDFISNVFFFYFNRNPFGKDARISKKEKKNTKIFTVILVLQLLAPRPVHVAAIRKNNDAECCPTSWQTDRADRPKDGPNKKTNKTQNWVQ
jgi:hypothetical protein